MTIYIPIDDIWTVISFICVVVTILAGIACGVVLVFSGEIENDNYANRESIAGMAIIIASFLTMLIVLGGGQ